MARESHGDFTQENLKTIAKHLTRVAGEVAALAEDMRERGLESVRSTHATAIENAMAGVDGFTAAVRKAIRNHSDKKTRTRQTGTKSEK